MVAKFPVVFAMVLNIEFFHVGFLLKSLERVTENNTAPKMLADIGLKVIKEEIDKRNR